MFKITILSILLLSTLTLSAEESYVFEAKGKFAKDLKALVEKYSKEGKIDVKVIDTSKMKNKTSIVDALLGGNGNADINFGKKIYDTNCFQCHGIKGNKTSYANARILSKLSKEEIIDQVENYKRDINYGGSTRFVMYNAVDSLNAHDIESVAAYITNINTKKIKSTGNKSTKTEDIQPESSSYLQ